MEYFSADDFPSISVNDNNKIENSNNILEIELVKKVQKNIPQKIENKNKTGFDINKLKTKLNKKDKSGKKI